MRAGRGKNTIAAVARYGSAGCARECGLLGVNQRWGESLHRLFGVKGGLTGWQGGNAHGHCSDGCGHVRDHIVQAVSHLKYTVESIEKPRCMDLGTV